MYIINGETYTDEDLMDSVMDGVCSGCGETYGGFEPDTEDGYCPECGENTVVSVLEIVLGGGGA